MPRATHVKMDDHELLDLVDRQAIINLLRRLVESLHAKRWREFGDCFLADASAQLSGGTVVGREAIVDGYRDELCHFHPGERSSGDYRVDIASDHASIATRVIVEHLRDDGCQTLLGHVDRDRLVRTPAGWRVARRIRVMSWVTLDAHLPEVTGLEPADGPPA